jgi:hypothetical protein
MTEREVQERSRNRSPLEAWYFGMAVVAAIIGAGALVVAVLLLAFGDRPVMLFGISAVMLASAGTSWWMSRLPREWSAGRLAAGPGGHRREALEPYDWDRVHAQIVRETFTALDIERAAALVGVLSDYRVLYSDALQELVLAVEGHLLQSAPVPTSEHAARVVAQALGMDPADLLTVPRIVAEAPVVSRGRRARE